MATFEYTTPVPLTVLPTTLKAITTKAGYQNSTVRSTTYTQTQVATPTFSPTNSTPKVFPVTVTISCATPGASIYYSLDGFAPTTLYTEPVQTSSTTAIRAYATKANMLDSAEGTIAYTNQALSLPVFTTSTTTIPFPTDITISSGDVGITGVSFYYTVDGSTPTLDSTLYTSPVTINAATTLKAIAYKDGYALSAVKSISYTQAQLSQPSHSSSNGSQYPSTLTLTAVGPSGQSLYYTTNGVDPTTGDTLYTAPFTVSSTTIKVLAVKSGYIDSTIKTISFTQATVATPTFSPGSTGISVPISVTISSATSGATIHYTTNGVDPTTSDTVYTTPITVSSAQTVKALAVKSGFIDSAIGSAVYSVATSIVGVDFTPTGAILATSLMGLGTGTMTWNRFPADDGSPFPHTITDIKNSGNVGTAIDCIISLGTAAALGNWAISTGSVNGFKTYVYASGTYNVKLDQLPAGTYQLLIYGHGAADNQAGRYTVTDSASGSHGTKETAQTNAAWNNVSTFTENVQYVRFNSITVGASGWINILVSAPTTGGSGYTLINCLQLVKVA